MTSIHKICKRCNFPSDQNCQNCQTADYIRPICTMCNHGAEIQCEHCQSVFYCSTDCKQLDFPAHTALCAEHTQLPPCPSDDHHRAILFPAQGPPQFVWIKCTIDPNTNEAVADTADYINANRVPKPLDVNLLRRRRLNPEIMVYSYHRQNLYSLPANLSIRNLAANQKTAFNSRDWHGPVVALGMKTSQRFIERFEDLALADFRDLIDYLCVQGVTVPQLPLNIPFAPLPKAKGVKIACAGDRACLNHDMSKYAYSSLIAYPLHDPVYYFGQISPISNLVGLPVLILKIPIDHDPAEGSAHRVRGHVHVFANNEASILQLVVDPTYNTWGTVQPPWNEDIGNVILTRQDGKDLMPQHGEALVEYARIVLNRMQYGGIGSGNRANWHNITTTINHEDFRQFFADMVEEREMVDSNWLDVCSPF